MHRIKLVVALLAAGVVTASAQQTFDPGHNDISIQPIGTSIKRCQFSPASEMEKIKGFDVPKWVDNPQVSFEQYRMGDAETGPLCQVPMLRGSHKNEQGYRYNIACFFEMSCTS